MIHQFVLLSMMTFCQMPRNIDAIDWNLPTYQTEHFLKSHKYNNQDVIVSHTISDMNHTKQKSSKMSDQMTY